MYKKLDKQNSLLHFCCWKCLIIIFFSLSQGKVAGIKVRMVTGDNKDTARAIAKECGILTDADDGNTDSVMEGTKMNSLERENYAFLLNKQI